MLKPQDLLVALKLSTFDSRDGWTYEQLAEDLGMSRSEVHAAVKRAQDARLMAGRTVSNRALLEFLEHGVQYSFWAGRGPMTRGIATGVGAPPLAQAFGESAEAPVWPHPQGTTRGYALQPLYKSVPFAAARDSDLYELLALTDAIREGVPREAKLAVQELRSRLRQPQHV